ncbi:hypothetical protein GGS20DRAFT_316619 [Poronia punctata]|nr:hypothetical protein GGS20DRAFT_316619 [Poronia punctata]
MASPDTKPDGPIVREIGDSLFEVTISRQNRVNLFSEAVQKLDQGRDEADVIIRNLGAQAPQLAGYFHRRTPELIYDVPFRLICESDLGYVPFDEDRVLRQYLVVSYSWRFDDKWPDTGLKPHAPWPVSQPFVEAILAERGVHTSDPAERNENFRREGIWFDQLCIRQKDEEEKMKAIAMMDVIYKSCRKLLIVLEDVVFNQEEIRVVNSYNALGIVQQASWAPSPGDGVHLASICRKIEESRWWTRSWCWHEFEVNEPWSVHRSDYYAHTAILIVGNDEGGTFSLKWLAVIAIRAASDPSSYIGASYTDESLRRLIRWTIADNTSSLYLDPTSRREGTERSSIMARFYVAFSSGCAQIADLIPITINVSGLAIYFTGRPDTIDEVFCIVAILSLAAGEKHALTAMSADVMRVDGEVSWLSKTLTGIETNLPKFTVGGIKYIKELTVHSAKLDLLFFDAAVDMPTAEEMQWTYQFFPDTPIRSRHPQYKKHAGAQQQLNSRDDSFDKPRRLFFLHACKNGLPYIRRLWETLEGQVVKPLFNRALTEPFTADESYRATAIKLLEFGSPADASNPDLQNVLVNLFSFIVDPRATHVMSLFTARIMCNGEEGVAMINNPITRATQITLGRWRLAIPRDLLDSPWHTQRMWLLEPYEDAKTKNPADLRESSDGRWRIVGKMQCLGNPCIPPLSEGEGDDKDRTVSLRTDQIVLG